MVLKTKVRSTDQLLLYDGPMGQWISVGSKLARSILKPLRVFGVKSGGLLRTKHLDPNVDPLHKMRWPCIARQDSACGPPNRRLVSE